MVGVGSTSDRVTASSASAARGRRYAVRTPRNPLSEPGSRKETHSTRGRMPLPGRPLPCRRQPDRRWLLPLPSLPTLGRRASPGLDHLSHHRFRVYPRQAKDLPLVATRASSVLRALRNPAHVSQGSSREVRGCKPGNSRSARCDRAAVSHLDGEPRSLVRHPRQAPTLSRWRPRCLDLIGGKRAGCRWVTRHQPVHHIQNDWYVVTKWKHS